MTTTRSASPSPVIDLNTVLELYRTYADALGTTRDAQRDLLAADPRMRPKLDDIEAELTYLLVRETRPARIVEIGTFDGWSMWERRSAFTTSITTGESSPSAMGASSSTGSTAGATTISPGSPEPDDLLHGPLSHCHRACRGTRGRLRPASHTPISPEIPA